MITGARQASVAQMPPGVECITLPALSKESKDCDLSRSLDIPVHELTKIRSQVIQASVGGFDPAVLIVDNVPRGAQGELDAGRGSALQ